jgi:hypothetical protein
VVDSIYVYYDLFTFFLQILLLWLCFFLLPCSKQKGAPRFKYDDSPATDFDDEGCCNINS